MTAAQVEMRGGADQPSLAQEQHNAELTRRLLLRERDWQRRQRRKKRGKPSIATLRVCELNRLFFTRYRGHVLPDDDDGRDSVEIMINHLAMLADPLTRIRHWLSRCAPWLGESEGERLATKATARPAKWKADTLAKRLNLTFAERSRLEIRTIGAVDVDQKQRKAVRRVQDKKAKEAKRRAAGAIPHAQSISQTKPWLALGISRSKWYHDQQKAREVVVSRDSGQFRRQYKAGVTVDEFVHPISSSAAPALVGSASSPTFPPRTTL
jgi:hypothetical protein